jgi:hypothetical protein
MLVTQQRHNRRENLGMVELMKLLNMEDILISEMDTPASKVGILDMMKDTSHHRNLGHMILSIGIRPCARPRRGIKVIVQLDILTTPADDVSHGTHRDFLS